MVWNDDSRKRTSSSKDHVAAVLPLENEANALKGPAKISS
jgi:hypothetical protein